MADELNTIKMKNKKRGTRRFILLGCFAMLVGIFLLVVAGMFSDGLTERLVKLTGIISLVGGACTTVIVGYMAAAAHEDKNMS